jgi:hypothetical protein
VPHGGGIVHRAVGRDQDNFVEDVAELHDGGSGDAQQPKLFRQLQRTVAEIVGVMPGSGESSGGAGSVTRA